VDDGDAALLVGPLEVLPPSADEVVEDDYLGGARLGQLVDECRPDRPGTAGDEDPRTPDPARLSWAALGFLDLGHRPSSVRRRQEHQRAKGPFVFAGLWRVDERFAGNSALRVCCEIRRDS